MTGRKNARKEEWQRRMTGRVKDKKKVLRKQWSEESERKNNRKNNTRKRKEWKNIECIVEMKWWENKACYTANTRTSAQGRNCEFLNITTRLSKRRTDQRTKPTIELRLRDLEKNNLNEYLFIGMRWQADRIENVFLINPRRRCTSSVMVIVWKGRDTYMRRLFLGDSFKDKWIKLVDT